MPSDVFHKKRNNRKWLIETNTSMKTDQEKGYISQKECKLYVELFLAEHGCYKFKYKDRETTAVLNGKEVYFRYKKVPKRTVKQQ